MVRNSLVTGWHQPEKLGVPSSRWSIMAPGLREKATRTKLINHHLVLQRNHHFGWAKNKKVLSLYKVIFVDQWWVSIITYIVFQTHKNGASHVWSCLKHWRATGNGGTMEVVCGPPQALTGVALEEPFPVEAGDAAFYAGNGAARSPGYRRMWRCGKATGKPLGNDLQMVFYPHGTMNVYRRVSQIFGRRSLDMAYCFEYILFPLNFLKGLSENKRQGGDERMTNSPLQSDRSYHHGALGPDTLGCWVGHWFVTDSGDSGVTHFDPQSYYMTYITEYYRYTVPFIVPAFQLKAPSFSKKWSQDISRVRHPGHFWNRVSWGGEAAPSTYAVPLFSKSQGLPKHLGAVGRLGRLGVKKRPKRAIAKNVGNPKKSLGNKCLIESIGEYSIKLRFLLGNGITT